MKILVVQLAFIGDSIVSLSLAEALHSVDPSCEIYYLVRPESQKLLSYSTSVQSVLTFNKYGDETGREGVEKKVQELNTYAFDAVLCLHESYRTRELIKGLSVPRKIGTYTNEVFTDVLLPDIKDDRAKQAAKLAAIIFPTADVSTLAVLELPPSLLPESFLLLTKPVACIAPGSVWQTKRWPANSYINLARELSSKGYSIVVTGLETDVSDEIKAFDLAKIPNSINYLSKLSLEETAAVIAHSDLLISNDSAPVHIAVATGTPVVDIFGPTVPEFGFAPRPESGVSIGIDGLWCRPCSTHGGNECPIHSHECMKELKVDQVLSTIMKLSL